MLLQARSAASHQLSPFPADLLRYEQHSIGVVTYSTAHSYEIAYSRWPADWIHGAANLFRTARGIHPCTEEPDGTAASL